MALYAVVKARNFFKKTEERIVTLEIEHDCKIFFCVHQGHLTLRRDCYSDWPSGGSHGSPLSVFNWATEKWS